MEVEAGGQSMVIRSERTASTTLRTYEIRSSLRSAGAKTTLIAPVTKHTRGDGLLNQQAPSQKRPQGRLETTLTPWVKEGVCVVERELNVSNSPPIH